LTAGTGLAAAVGAFDAPGSPLVQPLAGTVTVEGVGTQIVDLGVAPPGTTAIEVGLTCLTPGTFTGADGASLSCGPSDAGRATATWRLPASPGTTGTTIDAGPGERWRVTGAYSAVTTTEWGVNADGLTYGVANGRGTPDLLAVIATNGADGYVYSRDLTTPDPAGLQTGTFERRRLVLPVFEPDGKTQVGEFNVGG